MQVHALNGNEVAIGPSPGQPFSNAGFAGAGSAWTIIIAIDDYSIAMRLAR